MHFDLNWAAVVGAAVAHVALGFLWWSPGLFGKKWIKLMGWQDKSKEEMDKMKKEAAPAYAASAILSLVMAFVLANFIVMSGTESVQGGVLIGLWAWVGFVLTSTLTEYMYSNRSKELWWVNHGYNLVGLLIMGAILANWM